MFKTFNLKDTKVHAQEKYSNYTVCSVTNDTKIKKTHAYNTETGARFKANAQNKCSKRHFS